MVYRKLDVDMLSLRSTIRPLQINNNVMSKRIFKIGNTRVAGYWSFAVLSRAFKEQELKSLWESYANARHRVGHFSEPTDKQRAIVAYMKKYGTSRRETADHFKIPYFQVSSAMQRVAVWEYFDKE